MDLAVFVSLLFLLTDGSKMPDLAPVSSPSGSVHYSPPAPTLPADPQVSAATAPPTPDLLTVHWTSLCEGGVYLHHLSINGSSSPVCYGEEGGLRGALTGACLHKKDCEGTPTLLPSGEDREGYSVTARGVARTPRCHALTLRCQGVSSDVHMKLQLYKVLTALLCCVLLILLLVRFTRPTIRALQKRLSDRRQNRWIGPTQSHSVSYHRGRVGRLDGETRLCYPALERRTASSEPLSNRNSSIF